MRLIDVCALMVTPGSTNLDVHLKSCHMRDVLRYFRARAMMLVCFEIISVSVLCGVCVRFCDRTERTVARCLYGPSQRVKIDVDMKNDRREVKSMGAWGA